MIKQITPTLLSKFCSLIIGERIEVDILYNCNNKHGAWADVWSIPKRILIWNNEWEHIKDKPVKAESQKWAIRTAKKYKLYDVSDFLIRWIIDWKKTKWNSTQRRYILASKIFIQNKI